MWTCTRVVRSSKFTSHSDPRPRDNNWQSAVSLLPPEMVLAASICVSCSVSEGLLSTKCGERLFQLSLLQDSGPDCALAAAVQSLGHSDTGPSKSNTLSHHQRHFKLWFELEMGNGNILKGQTHSGKHGETHNRLLCQRKHVDVLRLPASLPRLLSDWVTQSFIVCYCALFYNQHALVSICGWMYTLEPWSMSFSTLRLAFHNLIRENCERDRNETQCCLRESCDIQTVQSATK